MLDDVTVILPAFNEAKSIGNLIDDIRRIVPGAVIFVGDNNSTDETAAISLKKGCEVIKVGEQGKGHVVKKLIEQCPTGKIIMADADNTYPVAQCLVYIDMLLDHNDFVIGYRKWCDLKAMPMANKIGNMMLSSAASLLYLHPVKDMCSGLWGLRKAAADRFVIESSGFTLEADMFSNAVRNRCRIEQIPITYRARLDGDSSKLKIKDGMKIGYFLLKKRVAVKRRKKNTDSGI